MSFPTPTGANTPHRSRRTKTQPDNKKTWSKSKIRARAVPALVVVTCLGLSVAAYAHKGVPTTEVDMNDGGIWVTNQEKKMVGHLNYQALVLDGALRTEDSQFDIGQAGDTVTIENQGLGSVAAIDTALVQMETNTSLPEQAKAIQGGKIMAVLDPTTGDLWEADATDPASAVFSEENAIASDMDGAAFTVGPDGMIAAISPQSGRMIRIMPGEDQQILSTDLSALKLGTTLSITTVGEEAVALDQEAGLLIFSDGTTRQLSSEGVKGTPTLGQPSSGNKGVSGNKDSYVLVATENALARVPLDGGEITQIGATGEEAATDSAAIGIAAAPITMGNCDYAAWAQSGNYLRTCRDESLNQFGELDTLKAASQDGLTFRTNRKLVVLNDISTGSIWLPDQDMQFTQDWDQLDSEQDNISEEIESPTNSDQIIDPEQRENNTPPIANDDELGARPGRTTTLPVLQNDSDEDGDVLTANPVSQPDQGTVTQTRGGRALQIELPEDAYGVTTFTYEASDGLAVDTANVTVNIRPWEENNAPEQIHETVVKIGSGAEIEHNVLPDWNDPDGDPIYLQNAASVEGLQVSFRGEGTVTVVNMGATPGIHAIPINVSDGRDIGTGELLVDVQPEGNLPPIANADFYLTQVGESVVLEPLANDIDPNGDVLKLVGLSAAPEGTTVVPDLQLGTATFTAQSVGTYYLTYTVSDGPSSVTGLIRIDVVQADETASPVAEDDLLLLPAGGSVLGAPLENDYDPAGGVLVLQSIDVPEGNLDVALIDHHLVRVSSSAPLEEAASFTYTVSNGQKTASATVMVIPTENADTTLAPIAQADYAKVRVGDVGSVEVLANDRSPAGLPLTLSPELTITADANSNVGKPFVTGDLVRLEAGTEPGILEVGYTVVDSMGNMSGSTVTFEVVPESDTNAAPQPKALTAWAVSGQTSSIPIPLYGIDPDGDSVTLLGVGQAPQKGSVTLGVDSIDYTAAEGATGTDTFTYLVEDRLGKQATATIRVGISGPSEVNQPPVAVDDKVILRPDRVALVPVMDNDMDPDGDTISLVSDGLQIRDQRIQAEVIGTNIKVVTPSVEDVFQISYRITDGRGGYASGLLTVEVSSEAELQAPIARDDVVAQKYVTDESTPVLVDVLANDSDPDGDPAKLVVEAAGDGVSVQGQQVSVMPGKLRRLVVYTITDEDGLKASAVISVPGVDLTYPQLDDDKVPVVVRAGETVTLDLNDYIAVRSGRTPHINKLDSVRASMGIDGEVQVNDERMLTFTASKDYHGNTAISFEVADGSDDDRSTLSATIALPIKVKSTKNLPPTLTPTLIRVGAGEEAQVVDLSQMVNDPEDADVTKFEYSLISSPNTITTSLNGHQLKVQAPAKHTLGSLSPIKISVDDGSGPVTADIPVSVVASSREKIAISDAEITTANAGQTVKVDITKYATNPFPDTELKIVDSSVSEAQGTVDPQGTILNITPVPDFHGRMVVKYTLQDATGDPSRNAVGWVYLTVRDRPDAPVIRSVAVNQEQGSGAGAIVSFTPGSDNGARITSYTISYGGGEVTCPGTQSSCAVNGLDFGNTYTFSMVAHNAAGDSDVSNSVSEEIDVDPQGPSISAVNATDRGLRVEWNEPGGRGSAVSQYRIYLRDNGAVSVWKDSHQGTSLDMSGLNVLKPYAVGVQSINATGRTSDIVWSAEVVPYGIPVVSNVQASGSISSSGDKINISLQWSLDEQGNSVKQIRISGSDGSSHTIDSSATTADFAVPTKGSSATYTVVAVNKAGDSAGAVSNSVNLRGTVPKPSVDAGSLVVTATGKEQGQVKITSAGMSLNGGNGWGTGDLILRVSCGSKSATTSGGEITLDCPVDGSYQVTGLSVRAQNSDGSAKSGSVDVTLPTPVFAPKHATTATGSVCKIKGQTAPAADGTYKYDLAISYADGVPTVDQAKLLDASGNVVPGGLMSPGETEYQNLIFTPGVEVNLNMRITQGADSYDLPVQFKPGDDECQ